MSGIYKMLFNLALKFTLIIVILILYGINPGIGILYLPFFLFSIIMFSLSVGLLFTPIGLIYTDISKVITTSVSFLMYFTPVVYAVPNSGLFKRIFELNPLTFLFNDTRNVLVNIPTENIFFTIIITILSILLMMVSLVIFRKAMPIIIEKIGG